MLQKAQELYIRDLVITSAELLLYFETEYPQNLEYKMLAVKLKCFEDVDLNNTFFDSLREDYGGKDFDDWFKRKGKEKAYVFEDQNGLKGFLYVKTEMPDEPDYLKVTPILSPKKRLKIGTFKINAIISPKINGEKIVKILFKTLIPIEIFCKKINSIIPKVIKINPLFSSLSIFFIVFSLF